MSIQIDLLVALLLGHFVADFIVQTRKQAENKSSDWGALTSHIVTYSLTLMAFTAVARPAIGMTLCGFIGLNAAAHFVTDAITSRITSASYKAGKMKRFWITIGADQTAHLLVLAWSAAWLIQ